MAGSRPALAVRLLAALVALAAATVVAADQTGLRSFAPGVRAGAAVTAAALAFVATAGSAVREYRTPRRAESSENLRYAVRQLAFSIAETTMIDVRDLGLAVYVVRRSRLLPWRRRLDRVLRERSVRRPSVSRVVWRPGKGVIGRCVANGRDVAQDVGADMARWRGVSRQEWESRVPDDVRAGFSYEEFVDMQGRYHVVVATPILDDTARVTRVVGCLALDGPEGSYEDLAADDVRAAMAAIAPTIRALLP
jgi:hypothetical protein